MPRILLVVCMLLCPPVLVRSQPVPLDEPKGKSEVKPLSPAERQKLEEQAFSFYREAGRLQQARQLPEAEQGYRKALAMYRQLYPKGKYPNGPSGLAAGLNNLAGVLRAQGKLTAAEPFYREALAMSGRLYLEVKYPDGHPTLATNLNNLALVLED